MALIFSLLIALLNTLLNHTMLTRKKSVFFCVVTFLLNTVVVTVAIVLTKVFVTDIAIYKYVFCLIMFLYIVYIHLVFEETIPKKLFVMFSTWVISGIIYHISIMVTQLFFPLGNEVNTINIVRILFQMLLLCLLATSWFRQNYKRILLLVPNHTMNWMLVYMLIAFLLLLNNMTNVTFSLRNFATMYDLILFIGFIILGYVIVFVGIASTSQAVLLQQTVEMAEKKSELHYKMANIDFLTGIASRFNILNLISDAIVEHQRNSQKLAVLMLDIDKFKLINDNYGHTVGDEVLKYLSCKISEALRESDSIGRVGGDEFVIFLKQIHDERDLESLMDRIFEALKQPLIIDKNEIKIDVSVGISVFPDHSSDLDSLINQADRAMYEAKKIVGCSYAFYQKGEKDESTN